MNNKRKLVIFLLSFFPGLSHAYLGLRKKALMFGIFLCGIILLPAGMVFITGREEFMVFAGVGEMFLWFFALVDALFMCEKVNHAENMSIIEDNLDITTSRKMITIGLSLIPGAGHMYLGQMRKGLELMSLFFGVGFLSGWLNMSLFLFAMPVRWFYSIFDALHNAEDEAEQAIQSMDLLILVKRHQKLFGLFLVLIGLISISEKLLSQYISWQINNTVQTGIIALVLIGTGIWLFTGKKEAAEIAKEEKIELEK